MRLYLTLVLLLPLFGSLANMIAGRFLPRRGSEWLSCGVIWVSFGCALAAAAAYQAPVKVELLSWLAAFDLHAPVSLLLDPLSLVMMVMITVTCGLIHVYSVYYMAGDGGYVRYFALLNLFVFAMLLLVLADTLPLLYLGWEGVGFCSYALIGFWYREEKNATAGRKAFIVTRIGDIALLVAVIWMFQLFSTMSISELNGMALLTSTGIITAIGLLLLAGATGKSAQAPLMVWLPDAMAGPTPVSAQIHAATMVTAGVYLLARLFPLIGSSPVVLAAIATVGGFTAFYAATCALAQRDLKRVLAYSTMSQLGLMMMAIGAGAPAAATFHLLIHAIFKALLFLGAGCVIMALHHEQDMFRMGGLRRSLPLTFWAFLAGALCLAGFPPTGGFFSKDAVLAAMWDKPESAYTLFFGIALATSFLTALYTFRMLYLVFGGNGRNLSQVPRTMELLLLPLALLGLIGGVVELPAQIGTGWLSSFLGHSPTGHGAGSWIVPALSAGATVAGLVTAHLLYGGERRRNIDAAAPASGLTAFLLNGWYVDTVYRAIFIRPFEAFARFFRATDETAIDGLVNRASRAIGASGEFLGRWTCGRISAYLLSFSAGAALLLACLAWMAF